MNSMTKLVASHHACSYTYKYSSNPQVQAAFEAKMEEASNRIKAAYKEEELKQSKCKVISEKEAFEIHLEQIRNPIVFKKA